MLRGAIRYLVLAFLAVSVVLAERAPAAAQSDILLQLRSGSPAGDRVRVDSAGGFVALGTIGNGIIPASGAGWRMMWYPFKVAFRAGYADAGNQMDDANIGFYSWGGGALTVAAGIYSFSFGNQNTVSATGQSGVAIGQSNDVFDLAGVALGLNNTSNGNGAVAIGSNNTADADFSLALGHRASANGHTGAMMFGDASTTDSIEAAANNEFAVRAAGGFRFRSNATLTNGCNIAAGGASITCASSRLIKHNYAPVDVEDVLRRLQSMELNTWNIIDEPSQALHMGLFAEDFYDAFGLGDDRRAIGHQDIDGVTVAGIMALAHRTDAINAQNSARDARVASLEEQVAAARAENAELRAQNAALEARLRRIEEALGSAE